MPSSTTDHRLTICEQMDREHPLDEPALSYEYVAYGRHSIVDLMPDDLFRVTCWGEGCEVVTWRSSAEEADEAARGWAHGGVLPQSQPTLRGLQPVTDEHAPGLQRARLMRGVHGDVTLGELEVNRE